MDARAACNGIEKPEEGSPAPMNLPAEWQAALARERQGALTGNDPARERKTARLLAAFVLTGLAFALLPGTLLGVWNLFTIATEKSGTGASAAWIQAHGQAQLFGWVGTFILGISLYLLPKTLGRFITHFRRLWFAWVLWTVGIALRWWAGVGAVHWRIEIVVSAISQLLAFILIQYVLWFRHPPFVQAGKSAASKPKADDLLIWLVAAGFASFGMTLLLNLLMAIQVGFRGDYAVYPAIADRIFLTVALWGFAIPMVWGYTTRFVTTMAGLQKPIHKTARWLSLSVLTIVALAVAKFFLLASVAALLVTIASVWILRIFHHGLREPKRVRVYGPYLYFIRLAYLWLVAGAFLGVWAALSPEVSGLEGASRHALTVGFLATMIFSVGPLILPTFLNGRQLWSPRMMGTSLWLLAIGCFLRVASEAVAYSIGGFTWKVLPVSALFELTAVCVFVVNLSLTVLQRIPAWFSLAGVTASVPLYFYVTSFPPTRRLLVEAGLKTLAKTREIPRTLTLADAAAADGASIDVLIQKLRDFFERRQPRRRA